ncbi:hypothetical protein BI364_08080 [Acidihalobacter yilgarnensis]|uniref:DUF5667 domain-containing protein n=1 Tax=Acidihalobacter yilgarnensis TaxID=2819280 RepID=A0A1D8IN81_9GAMM|nr:hypothetical protein [Acidihalobacter yilgarnensis]AOU97928.1 hypothetical protein BI364_08080 [Acidihalobacter yilgarnensis]
MVPTPGLTARYRGIHTPTRPERARRLAFCGALMCAFLCPGAWAATQHAKTSAKSDQQFDRSHYLIPGFSAHLIDIDLLVYQDLRAAQRAAARHDTLRLRIALADANGHLLQMATPPALAGLRDRIVMVSESLSNPVPSNAAASWDGLIGSIKRLPIPSADRSARNQLLAAAQRGQALAQTGRPKAAREQIKHLVAEIEITAHVFPIAHLRKEVRSAVDAASHGGPRWQAANKAIHQAISNTQWLIRPLGRNMIHAYDSAVAAYAEWPRTAESRRSLNQAAWYLTQVAPMRSLASQFRTAARNPALGLPGIAHLQHILALDIHHSRDALSQPQRQKHTG